MGTTEEQVRRKARVLAGFMSPQEAQGFVASFVLKPGDFMPRWTKCVAHCSTLAPGYTPPTITDLSPKGAAYVTALQAHPLFHQIYANVTFKMVELSKLIAMQHWMDTDVSDGIHGSGSMSAPSEDEVLERCLPKTIVPPTQVFSMAKTLPNRIEFEFYSHNNTFGIINHHSDPATGQVAFALGPNPNLMLVRACEGRFILANGYHRAWWLRTRGVDMVPAAIANVPSREQLAQPGMMSVDKMMGPRPPLVEDFLTDDLSVSEEVRAMLRMVRVTAEISSVPRLLG